MSMLSKRWVIGGFLLLGCFLAADLTAARLERKAVDSAPPTEVARASTLVAATPQLLKSPQDLQSVLNNTATASPLPTSTVSVTPTLGQSPAATTTNLPTPSAPLPRLVGTLAGSGHSLAVLQSDEVTRVCSPGDSFGDYKVLEVTPYGARLRDASGKPHLLQIGQNTDSSAPVPPAPTLTPTITAPMQQSEQLAPRGGPAITPQAVQPAQPGGPPGQPVPVGQPGQPQQVLAPTGPPTSAAPPKGAP